jgi:hypothetical protein
MKAVVYDKSNSPDVLVVRELEKPVPGDNEVLVRIHTVSINAADYRSMQIGIIPKRRIFVGPFRSSFRMLTTRIRIGEALRTSVRTDNIGHFE